MELRRKIDTLNHDGQTKDKGLFLLPKEDLKIRKFKHCFPFLSFGHFMGSRMFLGGNRYSPKSTRQIYSIFLSLLCALSLLSLCVSYSFLCFARLSVTRLCTVS